MFTLFSTIVGFITGYIAGKYNDDNLEEIVTKLNDKAKELDIDFKQIFLDAFDSLEKTDSDEIKANVIRAIDKIKEKTAEIAGEETLEESIEKIKENVHEIKDTFNSDDIYNDDLKSEDLKKEDLKSDDIKKSNTKKEDLKKKDKNNE